MHKKLREGKIRLNITDLAMFSKREEEYCAMLFATVFEEKLKALAPVVVLGEVNEDNNRIRRELWIKGELSYITQDNLNRMIESTLDEAMLHMQEINSAHAQLTILLVNLRMI